MLTSRDRNSSTPAFPVSECSPMSDQHTLPRSPEVENIPEQLFLEAPLPQLSVLNVTSLQHSQSATPPDSRRHGDAGLGLAVVSPDADPDAPLPPPIYQEEQKYRRSPANRSTGSRSPGSPSHLLLNVQSSPPPAPPPSYNEMEHIVADGDGRTWDNMPSPTQPKVSPTMISAPFTSNGSISSIRTDESAEDNLRKKVSITPPFDAHVFLLRQTLTDQKLFVDQLADFLISCKTEFPCKIKKSWEFFEVKSAYRPVQTWS